VIEPFYPRLERGARVAVLSPASAARPERVHAGVARLQACGYEPVVMPSALLRGPLYYAGTPQQRVSDLHAAYADPEIGAIVCTRGGWGSVELLPLLDRDLIRSHPKLLVGYSDLTSLHVWLWNECRAIGIHGPMAAADWSAEDGVDLRSWCAAVAADRPVFRLDATDGLEPLADGVVEGRLLGGCLSMLEAGLGTPWALRTEDPTILFIEDIGAKPYQWDRMLQHLRFAGLFRSVVGIVLGDMGACVEACDMELMRSACLHALRGLDIPIAWGLRSGHLPRENRSLPLGTMALLECERGAARLSVETSLAASAKEIVKEGQLQP
jgi:muramoyltetrapeptide carboxypeptidase